jgi:RimJ/RimL family protein N-acetyltransferase
MTDHSLIFRQITPADISLIFSWLKEAHVLEFWDSSQAHKEDILNFAQGRHKPSSYFQGKYTYWIIELEGKPFAFIMTVPISIRDPVDDIKLTYLSKAGRTYGIDYMIGCPDFLSQGYGAPTLKACIDFFRFKIDPKADIFLIDPATNNPRAKYVYEKAGFKHVADFIMQEIGASGSGQKHHLLVKQF